MTDTPAPPAEELVAELEPDGPTWTEELVTQGEAPTTGAHALWIGRKPLKRFSRGDAVAWIAGDGSAQAGFVLEVSAVDRWPTFEELRAAICELALEGTMFSPVTPILSAVTFDVPAPVLMYEMAAHPNSEAAQRLALTGGIRLGAPGPAQAQPKGGTRGRR